VVPRIVHVAVVADQRTAAVGELVEIVLAHDHRARVAQTAHNFRIVSWNAVLMQSTSRGRADACGVDQIFQSNGNAVHGPRHSPRRISASAARASARADSAVTVMKALSAEFIFSMRSRLARVISTGELQAVAGAGASSEMVVGRLIVQSPIVMALAR